MTTDKKLCHNKGMTTLLSQAPQLAEIISLMVPWLRAEMGV